MAGTEFGRGLSLEDISRGLFRLAAVLGQPFGTDRDALRQMASEWLTALSDMPPSIFEQAVTDWIATERKWPRPIDLREKAANKRAGAAHAASASRKVHDRRLNPDSGMITYPYMKSALRNSDMWDRWLDTIHPTAEHNFFVQAVMGRDVLKITVPNGFRADYIKEKFGDSLFKHFGSKVSVTVDASIPYTPLPQGD